MKCLLILAGAMLAFVFIERFETWSREEKRLRQMEDDDNV